jgi:hypothetical protein
MPPEVPSSPINKLGAKKMGRLYDGRRDRPVAWWQIELSSTCEFSHTFIGAIRELFPQFFALFFAGSNRKIS